MKQSLFQLGEFGLIDKIQRKVKSNPSILKGIGDDAAVIRASSMNNLVVTTDMLVEDVHFTRRMPADKVGRKSIAVSISDIAAMGAKPKFALVSLGAKSSTSIKWINVLLDGMLKCADQFGVTLIGGDTVQSEKVVINTTLIGEISKAGTAYRDGARAGDQIFITGPVGNSLQSGHHLDFVPRIAEAQYLMRYYKPHAMIDISDGLLADLGHILTSSQVGAELFEGRIPLRKGAKWPQALSDGEDFELLFTLPFAAARKLHQSGNGKFAFYHIGQIIKGCGCYLVDETGKRRKSDLKGYKHF